MATITTVRSGVWSDTSHETGPWPGASTPTAKPGASDDVVIAAGHTLTQDEDASVKSVTITSHATTPAKLTVTSTAGTYTLTLSAASSILGTNAAVLGQLYAGTTDTPLLNNVKWVFALGSTGSIIGTYLDIKLDCTQPTHRFVKLSQQEVATTTVLNVDTDVTGDWADGDTIEIININKALDRQRTTIATGGIAASTITISNALDSTNIASAYLVNVTRNIQIWTTSTNIAVNGGSAHVLQCEIIQTGAQVGIACQGLSGCAVSGTISGFQQAFYTAQGCTISGMVCGCLYGCNRVESLGSVISGYILGSSYAIASGFGHLLTGTIAGCTYGLYQCVNVNVSGAIVGCAYATISCNVKLLRGSVLGGASAPTANFGEAYYPFQIVGYGSDFRSTGGNQVYLYKGIAGQAGAYCVPGSQYAYLYDVIDAAGNPQNGWMKSWTLGGYMATETWVSGTHGVPPVALAYVHKHTFEVAAYTNSIDIPVLGQANAPIVIKVYARKQQNAMTMTPTAKICDPSCPYEHASEALATATMADNTDWQTLTLTYTPDHDRLLVFRVGGRNATGTMYWNYDLLTCRLPRPATRVFH